MTFNMKKYLTILGLPLLSFIIIILAIEVILRFYFYSVRQNYNIEMWRYATTLKQNVADKRSHMHIPNSSARIMGVDVNINSKGLRDKEFAYEKGENEYRILAVGDSITFGFGVEEPDTYVSLLEKWLNEKSVRLGKKWRYEVINGGIGNYNTEQELAFLTREGLKYDPDEVLLFFFVNDLEFVQRYTNNFFTQNVITFAFIASLTQGAINYYLTSEDFINYYKGFFTSQRVNWFQSLVMQFDEIAKSRGIKFRIVLLPELHSLKEGFFIEEYKTIKEVTEKLGVQTIDITSYFDETRQQTDYWVSWDDAHPNAEGHKIIADATFKSFYEQSDSYSVRIGND